MPLTAVAPDGKTLVLGMSAPARGAFVVTPDDATDFAFPARALYVASSGAIKVRTWENEDVTFTAVPSGFILPIRCRRVFAIGTAATGIVGLY